jgi:hypothetical protein
MGQPFPMMKILTQKMLEHKVSEASATGEFDGI